MDYIGKQWPNQLPERIAIFRGSKISMKTSKVMMHKFSMGDVEDPMIYAAEPIHKWQQSEKGKWCIDNAVGEIVFYSQANVVNFGYDIVIVGELSEADLTYFKLRWAE
jgi:hypothetical protein